MLTYLFVWIEEIFNLTILRDIEESIKLFSDNEVVKKLSNMVDSTFRTFSCVIR